MFPKLFLSSSLTKYFLLLRISLFRWWLRSDKDCSSITGACQRTCKPKPTPAGVKRRAAATSIGILW